MEGIFLFLTRGSLLTHMRNQIGEIHIHNDTTWYFLVRSCEQARTSGRFTVVDRCRLGRNRGKAENKRVLIGDEG